MAVHVPPDAPRKEILTRLHTHEHTFAAQLPPQRLAQWAAGRIALRAAVDTLGIPCGAMLRADTGGPLLPGTVAGSIAHKRTLAVALAVAGTGIHVGVDVEEDRPRAHLPAEEILTDDEVSAPPLPGFSRARLLLLRFSLKEAVYKAIYPLVRRYVGFDEISVYPCEGGTATIVPHTELPAGLCMDGGWTVAGSHLVTFTLVREVREVGRVNINPNR